MIDQNPVEYFEKREAEEREAATHAETEVARRIHLNLAEEYAARLRHIKGEPDYDNKAA